MEVRILRVFNRDPARRPVRIYPAIEVHPPVLHGRYDLLVYMTGAVVGGIGMLALLFGLI